MARNPAPARYFPVREAPYRLEAGLYRFGTDFGNGRVDAHYFQRDQEAERYRLAREATPRARAGILAETADERAVHRAVLAWIETRLTREHPDIVPRELDVTDPARAYERVRASVQEDLTVLLRDPRDEGESAIAILVDFPSGWRPERILGTSFRQIHAAVPGFAENPVQSASMVSGMVERGPYVRFVWTVCADDHLDHHPEEGRREPWREDGRGWLRVERQVTVPFPAERASLFLIRTYLYPFDELDRASRATLRIALNAMPLDVARYKGLLGEPCAVARRLLIA